MNYYVKITILTISIVALSEAKLYPLGSEYPVGQECNLAYGSPALHQLINRRDRVHGYFVNSEDIFFYAGDTDALKQFLVGFATLKNTSLTISINQSLTLVSSPFCKEKKERIANWRLYCAPYDVGDLYKTLKKHGDNLDGDAARVEIKEITDGAKVVRLQIRIGGAVELDKLKVPPHLELTLIEKEQNASQAIKGFVAQHEKVRSENTNQ